MSTIRDVSEILQALPNGQEPVSEQANWSSSGVCAESVMDTVPLVMRFIRAHVQGDEGDLPSIPQLRVLSCLTSTPGASLSDVARYINVTKATASTMVARMVERGLVQRLDDPNERRCVILNATPIGKEIYHVARNNAQESVATVLEKLTPEEKAKIIEGLMLLKEAFKR